MDPPSLISEGASFTNANSASYNLSEIWQFPMSSGGGVGESGAGLEMRRPQFGQNLGQFVNTMSANHEVSCEEPMSLNARSKNHGGGNGRKRLDLEEESAKGLSTSSGSGKGMNDCDGKRLKTPGYRDKNCNSKAEMEHNSTKPAAETAQNHEPAKQDYIHVRARRGQATDSHSLAERARREKISERMKILQDLVPGCNKVIGKALVLDEIINYIQSLQRQVEFLSMKLETVNSRMNPGIEVFPPKDFSQQTFYTAAMAYGSQASREYGRGSSPEWLHMQVGGGFERTP